MNIMGLVFSILLILSFGFYACLEKEAIIRRIDKTFIGQANVSRKILSMYEREAYKKEQSTKKLRTKKKKEPSKEKELKAIPLPPKINPECARINLWPLIETGREENQLLYEQLAQLLRIFYKKPLFHYFSNPSRLEYRFLDIWLASIKTSAAEKPNDLVILEKIDLNDAFLQPLYYNMLRGAEDKYPTLLDFVKVVRVASSKTIDEEEQKKSAPLSKNKRDPAPKLETEKLCLFHAIPQMLSVFFGEAAQAIYDEMHSDKIVVTEEMIEEICRRHRYTLFNKELFELVSLTRTKHDNSSEITLIEEDPATHISLRKKFYLPKS